jgi:MFS-type transporter involved in bile tolerance (Atg22 family)
MDDRPEPPVELAAADGAVAPVATSAPHALADEPPATTAETRAWAFIDVANSPYSTIAISGFLPLLLQASALAAAGFPEACGNVVTDPAVLAAAFPNATSPVPVAHYLPGWTPPVCGGDGTTAAECSPTGYCVGYPPSPAACRLADGLTPQRLSVGAGTDPTSYATLSIGVSILLQAAVFVCVAAVADYGAGRKRMLLASSWVGAGLTIACAGIGPATWWAGAPLMIASNVCFGLATVMYNSYLPRLVKALPAVTGARTTEERLAAEAAASDTLSGQGFGWGYAAGVVTILLVLPLAFTLSEIASYQGAMLIAGTWWAVWMLVPARHLRTRPGPPLPPGRGYVALSLAQSRETVRDMCKLPITGWYLLCWMVGSDAIFSVGTIGGLYADTQVDWGCTPRQVGVLTMFILVPVFGA